MVERFARRALFLFARAMRTRTRLVYPWELPSIMRKHIATGAMGSLYLVLVSGIYLVAFGNDLGMQYWEWGLLSSVSSFSLLLQLVSAYYVGRTGARRSLWFVFALVSRLLRGVGIVAAFALFGVSDSAARLVFMALLVLSNVFGAISVPPWMSWLADIIPRDQHGRFIGRRSAWIALANLCVVAPIGYAVDRFGGRSRPEVLLVVFAVGLALGMLDLFIHRTIPEPRMARPQRRRFLKALCVPLQDAQFRPWLAFNAFWTFAMTLGGSLATIYFVEDLGIRRNFLGGGLALIVAPLIGGMLTGRLSGGMVDRHGVRRVLRLGHTLWASLPAFWLFATPSNALPVLGAAAFVGGIGSRAALTAANKLITRLRPPEHVPMYTAVSTCVGCLAGGMGALLAGLSLHLLRSFQLDLGGFHLVGFHLLFAASFLLRACATLTISRLPDA